MNLEFTHLIGRPYVIGIDHCFKLCRDFYRDCFGIELEDFAIPNDWDSDRLDLIGKIHERLGFSKLQEWRVGDLQPGDALCVAINRSTPNHFVLYVGDNQLLHHPFGNLSRVEGWRDFWRNRTCYVLRHKDAPSETKKLPQTTIEELARARYHLQTEA